MHGCVELVCACGAYARPTPAHGPEACINAVALRGGPVMSAVRTEASRRPLQVPADSGDVRLSDIFDLTWSASFAHRGVVTRLVPSACTDELLMLGTNVEHGNWNNQKRRRDLTCWESSHRVGPLPFAIPMTQLNTSFDLIGDIHGHADELKVFSPAGSSEGAPALRPV